MARLHEPAGRGAKLSRQAHETSVGSDPILGISGGHTCIRRPSGLSSARVSPDGDLRFMVVGFDDLGVPWLEHTGDHVAGDKAGRIIGV